MTTKKVSYAKEPKYSDLEITDNNLLLQVLGPNDSNVKLIKKAFKIKVWLRGNLIKLSGTAGSVNAAENVFHALLALAESGKTIEVGDVNSYIEGTSAIAEPVKSVKKDGIISTPKKIIKPKTENQALYINNISNYDVSFGVGLAGCHRKGQLVIMYDGSLKAVEDVKVGDQLMGMDSTPRNVLELRTGHEDMIEIIPVKGKPWVVNKSHILTVKKTYQASRIKYRPLAEIKDVPVSEWENWSNAQKACHKLFRVAVNFEDQIELLPIDPYLLGLLLGDGHIGHPTPIMTTNSPEILEELEDKFIPHVYKTASRADRLAILAGLIDTDGSLGRGNCFDFVNKSKQLVDDVAFLVRSLGLACYPKSCIKKCQTGAEGTYYRLCISGDTDIIPTKIAYKKAKPRKQIKNVLHTGFKTKDLPSEDYYGFVLDGDNRYLLEDFTVTHNTGKSYLAMACAVEAFFAGDFRKIILCRPAVEAGEKLGFLPGDLAEKINPYLRPLYDALGDMVDTEKYADMIKKGVIEVAPLAFLRGRSLNHSFIILDEAQNTTVEQMKMFLTRMGAGSKMVINGDTSQVDLELYNNQRNGLEDAIYLLRDEPTVAISYFDAKDVVRHSVVQRIVTAYEAREAQVKEKLNGK